MKHLNNLTTTTNKDTENIKYLMLLCIEKPDLVIKTEFGTGRYKFNKFNELQGNLVLEFNLLNDNHYKNTKLIYANIGETCFLSVHQYLCVYSNAVS